MQAIGNALIHLRGSAVGNNDGNASTTSAHEAIITVAIHFALRLTAR